MTRTIDLGLPATAFAAPPRDVATVVHDLESVYTAHGAFVWRSLRALGVPTALVDDAVQDVFVVVHEKLAAFDGPTIRTWLFAIARRVASHYRRAAARAERSEPIDAADRIAGRDGTFEAASRNEAAALVVAVLAELDDHKRELLVLVELEQVPVPEVAAFLKIRLNTAYSRLRLARRAFAAALARHQSGVTR